MAFCEGEFAIGQCRLGRLQFGGELSSLGGQLFCSLCQSSPTPQETPGKLPQLSLPNLWFFQIHHGLEGMDGDKFRRSFRNALPRLDF